MTRSTLWLRVVGLDGELNGFSPFLGLHVHPTNPETKVDAL